MTSNNEINKNNNTFASNDAKADELKVINLDFNDNDCCVREDDWHHQFNTTDKEIMQENYENCKFQLEYNSELWTQEDLQIFAKQIQASSHLEPTNASTDYNASVNLWQTHGLTHQQYDAQLVYDNAVGELEAYYEFGEEDPEYETTLKTIIETFEKQMDEQLAAEAEADDENDWWMDANDCCESSDNEDEEDEDDEADLRTKFEDWMEAKREEDMEFARQNAMDDR
jgi:hypothetical protein